MKNHPSIVLKLLLTLLLQNSAYAESSPEVQKWEAAGFKNVEILNVDLAPAYQGAAQVPATKGLALVSVMFRGSGWTVPEITARTQDMTDTIGQCGVKLTGLKIITVDTLPGLSRFDGQVRVGTNYLDDPNKKEAKVANVLPTSLRPIMFYVQAIATDSAYANLAEAEPEGYKTAPVVDTIWIAKATTFYEHKYNKHYSVEAHELGHVLGKLQHLYPPKLPGPTTNLMAADLHKLSPVLTPAQCEKIRQSPLLSPFKF